MANDPSPPLAVREKVIESRPGYAIENGVLPMTQSQTNNEPRQEGGDEQLHANGSQTIDLETDGQANNSAEGVSDGQTLIVTDPADLPEEKKKKRRRKNKPASKRGIDKPTGMEEFFADSPMTPEQYEEVKARYDPNVPFVDRLIIAIQSFEFTRKLTNERRGVFYKWLHYGSVIVGSNIGTGAQNTEEMDKEQINESKSRVAIPKALRDDLETAGNDNAKYAVDFLACTKGFLSRRAPSIYAFDTKESITLVTTTVERFMDYLMQHDVCPEFKQDILEARNFCREASHELWSCSEALRWLPGDFNIACSTLFGGSYSKNYDGETFWGDASKQENNFVGLKPQEAAEIFGFAIAGAASEEVYERYRELTDNASNFEALEVVEVVKDQGFEIVDLFDPTADCKDMYKLHSDTYRPVGKVIAKSWINPLSPPEDLTPEEQKQAEQQQRCEPKQYEFFIEEIVMRNLSVGQKVIATIQKVNCGVWFFDEFTQILPDFDTFLINELMEDYREPRWLPGSYAPGVPGWKEYVEEADEPEY